MTPEEFIIKLTTLSRESGLHLSGGDSGELYLCDEKDNSVVDFWWNPYNQCYESYRPQSVVGDEPLCPSNKCAQSCCPCCPLVGEEK